MRGATIVATQGAAVRTGVIAQYDPFGNPIDLTTGQIGTTSADSQVPADTTTPRTSYGWEGSRQKPYLNVDGIAATEMGARQYVLNEPPADQTIPRGGKRHAWDCPRFG